MALTPTRRGVRLPDAGVGSVVARRGAWALLAVLLVANLVGAVTFDPPADRPLPGDGATHALQAASLAFDLDLTWSRQDLDRFAAQRGGPPAAVVLRSPDRGERIAYGVPVPWAVAAAPFVRMAPVRGPAVANALFLALAAVAAATTLERRLGPTAPLWVAAYAFASVAFVYTFRPTPELFSAALVAAAFALAYRGEGRPARRFTEIYAGTLPGEEGIRAPLRWLAVGALLATAATLHPFYLILLLPLALAVPKGRRRIGIAALLLSAVAALALWGLVSAGAGGSLLPWDRGGRVFTPGTGFPAVDVPVALWPAEEPALGWLPGGPPETLWEGGESLGLWAWDALFLAAGRHLGLLPYFLPLLLPFAAFEGARGRAAVPLAVGLALAAAVVVQPFELAGTADPVAAAYFLPLYPALWFLAGRPTRTAWIVLVAALAAPWLYPAWLAPRAAAAGGGYPSAVAGAVLPLETTQSSLPGVTDVHHGPLWLRSSGGGGFREGPGGTLRFEAGRKTELWIGCAVDLPALRLELPGGGEAVPTRAELGGAELLRTVLSPDGGTTFVLDPGKPDRSHRVIWSTRPYAFYHLTVTFPGEGAVGPVAARIVPVFDEVRP